MAMAQKFHRMENQKFVRRWPHRTYHAVSRRDCGAPPIPGLRLKRRRRHRHRSVGAAQNPSHPDVPTSQLRANMVIPGLIKSG